MTLTDWKKSKKDHKGKNKPNSKPPVMMKSTAGWKWMTVDMCAHYHTSRDYFLLLDAASTKPNFFCQLFFYTYPKQINRHSRKSKDKKHFPRRNIISRESNQGRSITQNSACCSSTRIQSLPGKRILWQTISPIMHPTDHKSTMFAAQKEEAKQTVTEN